MPNLHKNKVPNGAKSGLYSVLNMAALRFSLTLFFLPFSSIYRVLEEVFGIVDLKQQSY
jgi:hypothetical protein